ncbi:Cell division-associated, ATP-dependent zinc metalloprotease FtsH [Olavius algarvensis associated proteobacterium Delta 3]|nr:Cell division-associated, ATP-dependent zinc metalloprotease FtsH [Olavius algarvensis associated proteobacterium Delta 3]CAB5143816.1 Cell division-associated, ATP-dependent zinc metalloprotease FtsH [Olavius algarvensis associated proteobacterium Delta 3]
MDSDLKFKTKASAIYIIVAFLLILMLQEMVIGPMTTTEEKVPYSQFRKDLAGGAITEVVVEPERILYSVEASGEEPKEKITRKVVRIEDKNLVEELVASGVDFKAKPARRGILGPLLSWILPVLPFVLIWWFLMKRMGGGARGMMSIGKSKATEITGQMTGVTFRDVAGIDAVEAELKEIIEFLKDPDRFVKMGAKLPKGVLLVGPPGTGKTLLAKATAGEASVPFFSMSGSEFVEMFVGVGASRVRDLFEQAKAKAPCIIFIDEIDAVGQSRSGGAAMRTNDEREQTLNQLLYEMDGFTSNQGVVIMAATNRPEVLDKALLRAGRFDRQIVVPLPTEKGRRQILEIHARGVSISPEVDLDKVARFTAGFSGADLANLINEAALMAVRRGSPEVTMEDFTVAIERIVAGLQRDMPLEGETRKKVAYHESGHALVSQLLPLTDTVHKVSIIPTSKGALGYTMEMPEEDRYLMSKPALEQRMAVMLGGRAAELLVFQQTSTGASNDLERATGMARRMVTEFGMSEKLGPVRYVGPAGMDYLGSQVSALNLSPETERMIDEEIRRFLDEAAEEAMKILTSNESALHEIARILQEEEVIDGETVALIAGGKSTTKQTKDKVTV